MKAAGEVSERGPRAVAETADGRRMPGRACVITVLLVVVVEAVVVVELMV